MMKLLMHQVREKGNMYVWERLTACLWVNTAMVFVESTRLDDLLVRGQWVYIPFALL